MGGWRIAEELGSGHFAKVKRGIHITTNKQCAIKIVKKPAGAPPAIAQSAHHTCTHMQPATLAARVIASSPRRHRRQNGAGPDRGRYSEEGGPDFLRRPARARATLTALSSTGQSPVHCPLLRCHREGRPNLLLHGAVRARPRTPRARRPPPSLLSLLSRQPHPSNPAARVCGDVAL